MPSTGELSLFWKKKNTEDDDQVKSNLFKVPDSDQRGAFRVSPNPLEPIIVQIGDKKIKILEISSGGISLKNDGLKPKTVYKASFNLPIIDVAILTNIKILRVNKEGICQCVFVNMDAKTVDDVHRYVLARQKEELRLKNLNA